MDRKKCDLSILKVANGYVVRPYYINNGGMEDINDTHVFESFSSLVAHLKKALETNGRPPQA